MKTNLHLSIIGILLFCGSSLNAQVQWEGNGDGTSWDDAANWSSGAVPTAADTAEFLIDATLTGDLSVAPKRIKTGGQSTVRFHLDMNLDNVAGGDHAIVLGAKCVVEFGEEGTPYTFNFTTADNRHGLLANNSADSSSIVIMADATLNFNQHSNAINVVSPSVTVDNSGAINIASGVTNGIRLAGEFINAGMISISATQTDGILVLGGSFINTEAGTISIEDCGDDAVEVIDEGIFSNSGTLIAEAKDDASSGNNAIAVGTVDTVGTFINMGTGMVNVNGGLSENARTINVLDGGSLSNAGTITTAGGNEGSRIYSKHMVTNEKNGYINLTDGRMNINLGSFTNNGFVETTREGTGAFISADASIINNAFYRYENSNQLASGDGMIVDNGFSLNNIYREVIDAAGSCTVDIAEVAYDWTINNSDYASSMDDGTFSFLPNSIQADSVVLKTTLPEVNIKVVNICQEAVMTTDTDDSEFADQITIYPTLLSSGETINLESKITRDITIHIYDLQGRLVDQRNINGSAQFETHEWGAGHFIINIFDTQESTTQQIVIAE